MKAGRSPARTFPPRLRERGERPEECRSPDRDSVNASWAPALRCRPCARQPQAGRQWRRSGSPPPTPPWWAEWIQVCPVAPTCGRPHHSVDECGAGKQRCHERARCSTQHPDPCRPNVRTRHPLEQRGIEARLRRSRSRPRMQPGGQVRGASTGALSDHPVSRVGGATGDRLEVVSPVGSIPGGATCSRAAILLSVVAMVQQYTRYILCFALQASRSPSGESPACSAPLWPRPASATSLPPTGRGPERLASLAQETLYILPLDLAFRFRRKTSSPAQSTLRLTRWCGNNSLDAKSTAYRTKLENRFFISSSENSTFFTVTLLDLTPLRSSNSRFSYSFTPYEKLA